LRTCQDDVQQVQALVWRTGDPLAAPSFTYAAAVAAGDGTHDIWEVTVPGDTVNLWYQFRITDGATVGQFQPISGNNGPGRWYTGALQNPSWSLPVIQPTPTPPPDFAVPGWIHDAVIYQIFPDRFRNGDASNDPVDGTAVYEPGGCAGYPANCSGTYPDAVTSGDLGQWVCEHRHNPIAGMVQFRQATVGEPVTDWQNIGGAPSNHIAFGRGSRGFVAINRTDSAATTTYQTGMAAGVYCDVTQGQLIDNGAACSGRSITVNESGQIVAQELGGMDAFAIHVNQKVRAAGDPVYGWWSWPATPDAAGYRILRVENDPYFAPDPAVQPLWVTQSPSFYDPDAATQSVGVNHFYVVQALDAGGAVISAPVRRLGEFTFGLAPGN
jgi:hypothetical protein